MKTIIVKMKQWGKDCPVIATVTAICILFAIAVMFDARIYKLFAYHTLPDYPWQYLSGAFIHGAETAPRWFTWVHLGMNLLMIIPFGSLIERKKGSKNMIILFLTTWFLTSFVFKLMFWNTNETATGISAIAYAFEPVALVWILKNKDKVSKKMRICYYVLIAMAASMLVPATTGWTSFTLHMTGVLYGCGYAITDGIHRTKKK